MTELLSGDDSSARVKVEIRDDSSGGQTPPSTTITSDHLTSSSSCHGQGHNNNTPSSSSNNIVVSVNSNSCSSSTSGGGGGNGNGNARTDNWSWPTTGQSSNTNSGGSKVAVTPEPRSDFSGCGGGGGWSNTTTTDTTTTSRQNHANKTPTATTISNKNSSTDGSDRFPISSSCRDQEETVTTGEGSGPTLGVKGQINTNSNALAPHGGQQSRDGYANASKEDLHILCTQLENYIESIEQKHREEVNQLKESEEKIRIQQLEASRRENVLVMRLTAKEQEMQDYAAQLNELKASMVPTSGALRSTLLDPAVNFIIQKMKTELDETKKKLEDTQSDLNAWKFTPDSNTGKRLMAKCRMLYQENEELGKMVSSGRLAKLESDLALQKSLTVEMKKSQSELDELVQELDEDVEGMQSTILFLQQELRKSNSSTAAGLGNEGTGSSTSDSIASDIKANSRNNCISEIPAAGLVQIKISDLCAQCRTVYDGVGVGQKILTPDINTVTPIMSHTTNNDPVNSPIPQVENSERTCVNGEIDGSHSSYSNSTSNQSVQNVVNFIANANECDETDGGPPTSKRTKLHGDTAVVIMNDHSVSQSSGDTSSFNGNGSVEYKKIK